MIHILAKNKLSKTQTAYLTIPCCSWYLKKKKKKRGNQNRKVLMFYLRKIKEKQGLEHELIEFNKHEKGEVIWEK